MRLLLLLLLLTSGGSRIHDTEWSNSFVSSSFPVLVSSAVSAAAALRELCPAHALGRYGWVNGGGGGGGGYVVTRGGAATYAATAAVRLGGKKPSCFAELRTAAPSLPTTWRVTHRRRTRLNRHDDGLPATGEADFELRPTYALIRTKRTQLGS